MNRPLLSHLPEVRTRLLDADHVVVALDFDGTLAPIAAYPDDAALPPETAAVLRSLAELDHLSVAILSGRSIPALRAKVDLDLIFCGNHGLEIEGPGISYVHPRAQLLRSCVDFACWDLEAAFAGIRGITVERKGLTAAVHYRRAPAPLDSWIEATIRLAVEPYLARLALRPGSQSWEIRPRVAWNQASALKLLLERIPASRPLLVCAADDTTGEVMFRAAPDGISVHVGNAVRTRARFQVSGPPQLLEFLAFLRSAEPVCAAASS